MVISAGGSGGNGSSSDVANVIISTRLYKYTSSEIKKMNPASMTILKVYISECALLHMSMNYFDVICAFASEWGWLCYP